MNTRVPMPTDTPELAPPTIAPVLPEVSFHEIWGVDESGTIPPAQFWVRRHLTSFRSPSPLYTKKKTRYLYCGKLWVGPGYGGDYCVQNKPERLALGLSSPSPR